jgi:hypothetical protein
MKQLILFALFIISGSLSAQRVTTTVERQGNAWCLITTYKDTLEHEIDRTTMDRQRFESKQDLVGFVRLKYGQVIAADSLFMADRAGKMEKSRREQQDILNRIDALDSGALPDRKKKS